MKWIELTKEWIGRPVNISDQNTTFAQNRELILSQEKSPKIKSLFKEILCLLISMTYCDLSYLPINYLVNSVQTKGE